MLKKLVTFLGLFACVAFATDVEIKEEEDVLVLTDDNFDAAIAKHPMLLVEFYAPWCGHCKSLAPEYAKAAGALKKADPAIPIAKCDATVATKMAEKYGVQGFPTLKLFKGSAEPKDVKEYDGGRTADEIEKWMIKKSGPSVKVISTVEELTELKEKNDVVIVALLESVDGDDKLTMEAVSDADDHSVYVATTNADLVKDDVTKAPGLVLYKKFDELKNVFAGEKFEKDALIEFVAANNQPLIVTFSQEKAPQIFGGNVDVHMLMFTDASKDYAKKVETAAKKSAVAHKGKIMHITIPHSESRILDYFGFKETDLPAVILVNMAGGMKKFPYKTKASELEATLETTFEDDLLKFEESYLSGEMKPVLKSAEPVDDSEEAVKVLTGKDFNKRVMESDKDVLVEFYAPWCGHCKSLAPKYEELAESFSGVDSIMIAKMDSTENEIDVPGVTVEGFPTIYFFPANDKKNPVAYDGGRDVAGFTEFLKKNAKKFELNGESHGKAHDEL